MSPRHKTQVTSGDPFSELTEVESVIEELELIGVGERAPSDILLPFFTVTEVESMRSDRGTSILLRWMRSYLAARTILHTYYRSLFYGQNVSSPREMEQVIRSAQEMIGSLKRVLNRS